jgi:23S rRNA (adenine2030-N6)-methyltransferase
MLRVELIPSTASEHLGFEDLGLRGSGLIFVNPPWTLHDELKVLLPALRDALSRGSKGSLTLDWLSGETAR